MPLRQECIRLGNRTGILLRRAGDLADSVDQHLGLQAAKGIKGEVRLGLGPAGAVQRRKLVGLRVQDQPVDVLQVVMRSDQFVFQVGQQLGVARRVVGADVVRLVNDAAAIEPAPGAIDDVAGKPGVLGIDQPIGKDLAGIAVRRNTGTRAVGKDGTRGSGPSWHGCRPVSVSALAAGFCRASRSDRRRRSPLSTRPSICNRSWRRRPTCRPGVLAAISPPGADQRQGHGLGDRRGCRLWMAR